MSFDQQGRFLFFSDSPLGTNSSPFDINGFTIAADGTLHQIPGLPLSSNVPGTAEIRPDGRFVYVVGPGGFGLGIYAVDSSSGQLTFVEVAPFPSLTLDLPVGFTLSPDSKFIITQIAENTLSVYSLDPNTGMPSATAISSFDISAISPGQSFWQGPILAPSGHGIFLFNLTSSRNIAAFSLAADGTITAAPGSPFTSIPNPCCFTFDPTSRWLFVGSFLGPGISGFHIESSGALTPVAEPALANTVFGIAAFDSSGKYLYVSDGNGVVSGFQLDPNTGILTPLP